MFLRKTLIIVLLILIGCKTFTSVKIDKSFPRKNSKLTIQEWRNWIHKDIIRDTIAGISLDKAYKELLDHKKKRNTIIVALLDNRIDAKHEDIKDFIWKNIHEIPNNNIDDDQNGYVDDTNGWNFLGTTFGQNVDRASFEFTRIVRKYQNDFLNKNILEVPKSRKEEFILYTKAKTLYDESLKQLKNSIFYLDSIKNKKTKLYNDLKLIYNDTLLSQANIEKVFSKDSLINIKINNYKNLLNYEDWISNTEKTQKRYSNIYLSLSFNDRERIGDDVDNIKDTNYGNGKITAKNTSSHNHAIKVAGVLGANRYNNIGIKGISNALKIMPVCVSPSGDEQDKDIALGIRYAVDNGAKIIIMTFTKYIVQHNNWIQNAIKYANDKDVLIVLSAGNSSKNSDIEITYPNDVDKQNNEYVNNIIVVGGSTSQANEKLVADFSNYGKNNVDIFAPAKTIYTTKRNQKYGYESGTSMSAPIVAGVAALIRSYYPNLTASEVKQIIMESGVSYDIMVNKPSASKEKELVPFSSLSKSGKIVNAYNALLLAEEVSKKKKRK
ncbi:S8 family serine peptidase [Kordia jejudonensis]|uniref:S8 family serine peptidase n=1 Tax=Kordia jejudonensis TaxID=1348245 RepID=UPI00062915FC|nr:S8 family serine peptidase [Kordia jejudonensis]